MLLTTCYTEHGSYTYTVYLMQHRTSPTDTKEDITSLNGACDKHIAVACEVACKIAYMNCTS